MLYRGDPASKEMGPIEPICFGEERNGGVAAGVAFKWLSPVSLVDRVSHTLLASSLLGQTLGRGKRDGVEAVCVKIFSGC